MNAPQVLVVGSANIDYTTLVSRLPVPGETVLANGLRLLPGGKGMNQAVASARLGAAVTFVGSVGVDSDGSFLIERLREEGVRVGYVVMDPERRTGLAVIAVLPSGENSILVVPGANEGIDPAAAAAAVEDNATPGSVVVVQAEIPMTVVQAVAQATERVGARLLVNLAPYFHLVEDVLHLADPLVVNQVEASELYGAPIDSTQAALVAAQELARRARSVVITLGEDGACWAASGATGHVRAPAVSEVVDSTGAGDAFVGALAALLAEGSDLARGTHLACQVAGFAVGRAGAQTSYPSRQEAFDILVASGARSGR